MNMCDYIPNNYYYLYYSLDICMCSLRLVCAHSILFLCCYCVLATSIDQAPLLAHEEWTPMANGSTTQLEDW